jgi:Tetracyclin repressor-like, C-terminal domain
MSEKMEATESALDGICAYWQALGDFAAGASRSQGCVITNASVELAHDSQILNFLKTVNTEYDTQFKKTLDLAVRQGELRVDTDTMALAQYLSRCAQGLRALVRMSPDKKKAQNIVGITMSTLTQFRV